MGLCVSLLLCGCLLFGYNSFLESPTVSPVHLLLMFASCSNIAFSIIWEQPAWLYSNCNRICFVFFPLGKVPELQMWWVCHLSATSIPPANDNMILLCSGFRLLATKGSFWELNARAINIYFTIMSKCIYNIHIFIYIISQQMLDLKAYSAVLVLKLELRYFLLWVKDEIVSTFIVKKIMTCKQLCKTGAHYVW